MFIILKRNWGIIDHVSCINVNMNKLWQKDSTKLHPLVEKYTVGEDYLLDRELIVFDIEASKAHAKGLERVGILSAEELGRLVEGLETAEKDWQAGKLKIKIEDEDCHTVIENYLVEKLGDVGKKIHTGRSRNDQVLAALRLYMKAELAEIKKQSLELALTILKKAREYALIPLPGYSHTQQAMLSSVGHYYCALTESLLDDIEFLDSVKKHIDKNPLGSAAGFGVAIPLDRQFTTAELGFARTQVNSLYCQNSRGKFESVFLEGLSQIMMTLGRFANDLLLFTASEFVFFEVPGELTTGSSIMPQKKNLDAMEILRGNVSVVIGYEQMVKDIAKNLLSGYNRDLQLIKKPVMGSVAIVWDSIAVVRLFVESIKPKQEAIEKKITKEIFMADIANSLVKEQGMPFRDAYLQAKKGMDSGEIDFQENIKSKTSLGAPGNLGLDDYQKRIEELSV